MLQRNVNVSTKYFWVYSISLQETINLFNTSLFFLLHFLKTNIYWWYWIFCIVLIFIHYDNRTFVDVIETNHLWLGKFNLRNWDSWNSTFFCLNKHWKCRWKMETLMFLTFYRDLKLNYLSKFFSALCRKQKRQIATFFPFRKRISSVS